MNRRNFLKKCSFMVAVAAIVVSSANAGVRLANSTMNTLIGKRRPNIIHILADDQGYGEVGCYGQQLIETPSLDRLAAEGMRFTQHYAGNAVCAPSRCTLLTGLHQGHAYIRGNYEYNSYQWALGSEGRNDRTIGHVFQEAGYVTGCIGKWGMGGPDTSGEPGRMGFDHFYGYLGQVQAHSYYPGHLWRCTEGNITSVQESLPVDGISYSHDLLTKEALWFISNYKDRPFFLHIPYTIPHTAYSVPDQAQYEGLDWGNENWNIHAAMISRMDGDIGKIMDLVKELGLDEDTIIIFTSDNGPIDTQALDDFFDTNGGLRGMKRDLYEGGVREPFIARWPGKIKAGSVTDHISTFWDFYPTCCDILGVEPPKVLNSSNQLVETDGISYLPTLLGRPDLQQQHDYVYWEFYEENGKQAIRQGDWKMVRLNVKSYSTESAYLSDTATSNIKLYNLATDPDENNNLSSTNTAKRDELKNLIVEAHTKSGLAKFQFPWE
jgi:arylsulfatase A-like enzyme